MARPRKILSQTRSALAAFLETEASGGVVLFGAAILALLWANMLGGYAGFWQAEISIGPLTKDLQHWVNDGLMTIFFFVVGLEIKRELVLGELRDFRVASLPLVAAVGGMIGPAVIYVLLNGDGEAARGWAIPMATDIAFVVGALSLLGSRVPSGLKLFLLTLAIIDDVGAIVVIAAVYSGGVDPAWLGLAAAAIAAIFAMRLAKIPQALLYVVPGAALWYCVLRAGIHPTLAGVALGLITPTSKVRGRTVLEDLEARLHPLSSYLVVPVFGLANAGVVITVSTLRTAIASRVFLGIVGGLVIGKLVGIFALSRIGELLRIGRRPGGVLLPHLAGGAALSGIGFTVSLFIVGLAFTDRMLVDEAKLAVLAGSVIASTLGAAILTWARAR